MKYMDYENFRRRFQPKRAQFLLIAESPPPAANVDSSRHFYRTDRVRRDDRLFVNTMRALYPEAANLQEVELETQKSNWLRKFQDDGWYMIEALDQSQPHEATKQQRQERIRANLPHLLTKVAALAHPQTRIILIKSNVFDVAAEPLRQAGFTVLNQKLLDYPGRFNQRAYREKLAKLIRD